MKTGKEWNWVWDEASAADAGVPYPYPGFSNFAFMALAPYPQVAETWGPLFYVGSPLGSQSYNALQVTLNKRRSHGVTASSVLHVSRSRGNVAQRVPGEVVGRAHPGREQPRHGSGRHRQFDQTHVLKGYVAWELPFGKGRRFVNKGGLTDAVLGGWEVSLIFRYDTGAPLCDHLERLHRGLVRGYPIYVNRNPNVDLGNNFDPASFDMANPACARATSYFDPSGFSNPAYGEFGTGPGGSRSCGRRAGPTRTSA